MISRMQIIGEAGQAIASCCRQDVRLAGHGRGAKWTRRLVFDGGAPDSQAERSSSCVATGDWRSGDRGWVAAGGVSGDLRPEGQPRLRPVIGRSVQGPRLLFSDCCLGDDNTSRGPEAAYVDPCPDIPVVASVVQLSPASHDHSSSPRTSIGRGASANPMDILSTKI